MPTGAPSSVHQTRTLLAAAAAGTGLLVLVLVVTLALGRTSPNSGGPRVGASSTTAFGEVTGVATPCVGVATLASFQARPVHVTLRKGTHVVRSETVTGDHRFLIAAAPGRYEITSDQYQRAQLFPVEIHRLRTVRINFPVSCK